MLRLRSVLLSCSVVRPCAASPLGLVQRLCVTLHLCSAWLCKFASAAARLELLHRANPVSPLRLALQPRSVWQRRRSWRCRRAAGLGAARLGGCRHLASCCSIVWGSVASPSIIKLGGVASLLRAVAGPSLAALCQLGITAVLGASRPLLLGVTAVPDVASLLGVAATPITLACSVSRLGPVPHTCSAWLSNFDLVRRLCVTLHLCSAWLCKFASAAARLELPPRTNPWSPVCLASRRCPAS